MVSALSKYLDEHEFVDMDEAIANCGGDDDDLEELGFLPEDNAKNKLMDRVDKAFSIFGFIKGPDGEWNKPGNENGNGHGAFYTAEDGTLRFEPLGQFKSIKVKKEEIEDAAEKEGAARRLQARKYQVEHADSRRS